MIIAQISDSHIASDAPDASRRISDLELTLVDINTLDPLPDAIVHTGDITHNGRENEYAQAMAILANARVPVYVLAGNKDNRGHLRAAFSRFGYMEAGLDFIQYAIDRYPVRLIALDTVSEGNKGRAVGESKHVHLRRLRKLTGNLQEFVRQALVPLAGRNDEGRSFWAAALSLVFVSGPASVLRATPAAGRGLDRAHVLEHVVAG